MKSRLTKSLYKQTPLKTGDSIYPLKSKYLYMKKILVFVLLMVAMFGYGQDVPSPYKFTSIVDLYEFPTVGATGNLDVQLPLYTVNTKGFELPLSLSYDQMGNTNVFYMGNQFGDAWVLNVAGTISRKCVDRPTPTYSRSEERRVGKECRSRWS